MNVSGIKSIEITDNCFDYEEILDTLAAYRSENERHVEIEFYDVRNMADRLLTEFSPWKKKCIFEKSTGLYKLKIFYQSQDETELVVRLMGYGADVHFPDSNHPICREITRRIHEQMKIMKEKNYFKKQKREKRERGKIDR
jgi:hypothetical protein